MMRACYCDVCTEFNHLKVGKSCEACDQGVVDIPMLMLFFFAFLAGASIAVTGVIGIMRDHGIVTDGRLIVGFYQILAQMSNVLYIELPSPVPRLSALVSILFLDVRNIIKLDCWDIGGFCEWLVCLRPCTSPSTKDDSILLICGCCLDGKLTTNLLIVPAIYIAACVGLYYNQRRTIAQVIKAGAADESAYVTTSVKLHHNLFLGIFLLCEFPRFGVKLVGAIRK